MGARREFSSAEADEIRGLLHAKVRSDRDAQKRCRRRLRVLGFYISAFSDRTDGFTAADFDTLIRSGAIVVSQTTMTTPESASSDIGASRTRKRAGTTRDRDEAYVVDLCDEILGSRALRQHRFPFLVGDNGHRLPVDAYYPERKLVIEYLEKQHRESVAFFDRRMTVSGVSRGEQRRLYDERRRQILPSKGIALVDVSSEQLCSDSRQRLVRDKKADLEALRALLRPWADRGPEHAV